MCVFSQVLFVPGPERLASLPDIPFVAGCACELVYAITFVWVALVFLSKEVFGVVVCCEGYVYVMLFEQFCYVCRFFPNEGELSPFFLFLVVGVGEGFFV
jgi:hypothetical protein